MGELEKWGGGGGGGEGAARKLKLLSKCEARLQRLQNGEARFDAEVERKQQKALRRSVYFTWSTDLRDQLNAIDKCSGNFSFWDWVFAGIIPFE